MQVSAIYLTTRIERLFYAAVITYLTLPFWLVAIPLVYLSELHTAPAYRSDYVPYRFVAQRFRGDAFMLIFVIGGLMELTLVFALLVLGSYVFTGSCGLAMDGVPLC